MRPLSLLLPFLLAILPEMLPCLVLLVTMQLPLEPAFVLVLYLLSVFFFFFFLGAQCVFGPFNSTFRTIFLF